MNVSGAPVIRSWNNAAQSIATASVGELMTAQAESRAIVITRVVRLPKIKQRSRNWFAVPGKYQAREFEQASGDSSFVEIGIRR
jgi:hypothetical protein